MLLGWAVYFDLRQGMVCTYVYRYRLHADHVPRERLWVLSPVGCWTCGYTRPLGTECGSPRGGKLLAIGGGGGNLGAPLGRMSQRRLYEQEYMTIVVAYPDHMGPTQTSMRWNADYMHLWWIDWQAAALAGRTRGGSYCWDRDGDEDQENLEGWKEWTKVMRATWRWRGVVTGSQWWAC